MFDDSYIEELKNEIQSAREELKGLEYDTDEHEGLERYISQLEGVLRGNRFALYGDQGAYL